MKGFSEMPCFQIVKETCISLHQIAVHLSELLISFYQLYNV